MADIFVNVNDVKRQIELARKFIEAASGELQSVLKHPPNTDSELEAHRSNIEMARANFENAGACLQWLTGIWRKRP